jgi:predicted amidohydrolase YtcJ
LAAEQVWHDIKGYTSTSNGLVRFSTLVVDDSGKVVATGDKDLLERYPDATKHDGGGRTLLPGLIDAHAHLFSQGQLTSQVDLVGSTSLDVALERIGRFAEANPRVDWILGRGWNQVLWESNQFPTAADIDSVVADRPVHLRRIDGHASWANSRALDIAGIDRDTPDPIGGKILRDENGDATGVLIDRAMELVGRHVPPPDKTDIRRMYKAANDMLLPLGLTSIHDAGINLEEAEVLIAMADDGELDIRVAAMLAGAGEVLDGFGTPLEAHGNDHLDVRMVKLFSDGALGSRGAAMIEPYSDDAENRGLPFWTQDELDLMVKKANDRGFQVGVHAIGDLGNRMVIEAFDHAQGGKPSPLRNRIEHTQIVALEDIPRIAELGLVASMQPIHATSDMNMAEDRVGPERIQGGYAWQRMLDAGIVIASGSDFPVELPNPFLGLYAAVTRQDRDGMPEGGWYADQALSREEALHSFTLAAAYAARQEDRLGSLEPGKWADFIVIDQDYFEIPASEIDDIQVRETWVAGKRVFARQD